MAYFITSRLIDMVENGFSKAKSVMIITDDGRHVADEIYARLGRTVTTLEGEGLISGKKSVLYCVITQLELIELKKIIRDADQSAFVTVSDVSEIVGKHIEKNDSLQTAAVKRQTLQRIPRKRRKREKETQQA